MTSGANPQKNFLIVDTKTETRKIEEAFEDFTQTRKDIGIVLINQHVRLAIRSHRAHSHDPSLPLNIGTPHLGDGGKDGAYRALALNRLLTFCHTGRQQDTAPDGCLQGGLPVHHRDT